jgi:hypothetical protein
MQPDSTNPTDPTLPTPSPKNDRERVRPIEYALVAIVAGVVGVMAVPELDVPKTDMVGMAQVTQLQYQMGNYRDVIESYRADHKVYPGYAYGQRGAWLHGSISGTDFRRQMLFGSTEWGRTSPTDPGSYPFGPYLETGMIKNPVNGLDTVWLLADDQDFPAEPTGTTGWIYRPATGEIIANCEGVSVLTGVQYFDL